jgi:hypothetical protein
LIGLGYSDTEHKQGWDLDEPTFRRATAALLRLHPEQHGYIFGSRFATGPTRAALTSARPIALQQVRSSRGIS